MSRALWVTALRILACTVLLVGCDRHGEQTAATGSVENIRVTYKPSAHVLRPTEAKDLILGISSNGAGYLLDGKNPAAASYKVGDSLVIKGLVARKIVALDRTDDGSIILLTQQAHLTDVVQDGKIRITKPIRFDGAPSAEAAPQKLSLLSALIPSAHAATGDAAGGIRGSAIHNLNGIPIAGWTVNTTLSTEAPQGMLDANGRLKMLIELTRNEPGYRGKVTASGFLQTFVFDSDISIANGTMEKLKSGLQNVNGDLTIEWEMATEGHGFHTGDDHIELPPLLKVRLAAALDGLPVFLNLTSSPEPFMPAWSWWPRKRRRPHR